MKVEGADPVGVRAKLGQGGGGGNKARLSPFSRASVPKADVGLTPDHMAQPKSRGRPRRLENGPGRIGPDWSRTVRKHQQRRRLRQGKRVQRKAGGGSVRCVRRGRSPADREDGPHGPQGDPGRPVPGSIDDSKPVGPGQEIGTSLDRPMACGPVMRNGRERHRLARCRRPCARGVPDVSIPTGRTVSIPELPLPPRRLRDAKSPAPRVGAFGS